MSMTDPICFPTEVTTVSLIFLTYSHEKGCIIDKNLTPKLRPMYIEFYVIYMRSANWNIGKHWKLRGPRHDYHYSLVMVCVANPNKHEGRVLKTAH